MFLLFSDNVWQVTLSPVLIVLVSVICGLVFVALVVVLAMKCRTRRGRGNIFLIISILHSLELKLDILIL